MFSHRWIAGLSAVLGLVLLASLVVPASSAEACETPLPDKYEIAAPGAGVPAAMTGFLGIWGKGKWDGYLCNTLVVEDVAKDGTAFVIYSWGTHIGWNIQEPGYVRSAARIADGVLHIEFKRMRTRVEYRLSEGGLKGKYFTTSSDHDIELERIPR